MEDSSRSPSPNRFDNEDDDEVVLDIPVYLNHLRSNSDESNFNGELYLLQYPLRPKYRSYGDQGNLDAVELRPEQKKIRMAYSLCEGENFDDSAVENSLSKQWFKKGTLFISFLVTFFLLDGAKTAKCKQKSPKWKYWRSAKTIFLIFFFLFDFWKIDFIMFFQSKFLVLWKIDFVF